MEINRFEDAVGIIPTEDITEGRFVLLTTQGFTYDFGSREDLAGVKLPDTADEAKRAKFIITWAVDNRTPPYYEPQPSLAWAFRGGFDQSANVPFDAKVRLTYPGYQDSQTIPSGIPSLAFTEGTFTIPSSGYIASDDIIKPGAAIIVANTAEDGAGEAGKAKYQATFDDRVIGYTERYDSSTHKLTVRVE